MSDAILEIEFLINICNLSLCTCLSVELSYFMNILYNFGPKRSNHGIRPMSKYGGSDTST